MSAVECRDNDLVMTTMIPSETPRLNVADRLAESARRWPDVVAVAEPTRYERRNGRRQRCYVQASFSELDADVDRIARGLVALGVEPGARMALLVRPGIDFIALTFALLRCGAVTVLIDPGMGRKNLIRCLEDAQPEGFVAIPPVHAVRTLLGRRFARARLNVTVGRRWFWGGVTLGQLRKLDNRSDHVLPTMEADDPATIIFTTGSTGPPKGVLYRHGNFDAQVTEIRDRYEIQPGEVDLPGFPLFGLFNAAMGVTTVIPDMDPTRPAQVNPEKIIEAVNDWNVTQAFGSPAIWNRIGRYCEASGKRLLTVRRVLSAGAPVPADVLRRMTACIHTEGQMHTPYGATESLPVASISAREVLSETAEQTDQGAGVCVGRKFSQIDWKVIRIVDGPIRSIEEVELPAADEIGELIVTGPQVTREYATRSEWNARSKIADGSRVWHRIGDCGYFDSQQRFWFCGRVAHRVLTQEGPMYPVQCEAIFNSHPDVFQSALVGVGPSGKQRPVLIVERADGAAPSDDVAIDNVAKDDTALIRELRRRATAHRLTQSIRHFLMHRSLPVDIRHNAKIFREQLATWAERRVEGRTE